MPLKSNRKNSTRVSQQIPVKATVTWISVSLGQTVLNLDSLSIMKIICLRGPQMPIQSPCQPPAALPCEHNPWGKVLPHLNETWLAHYLFRQATSTYDSSFPYFVLPVKQPSAFTSQLIIKEQKRCSSFQPHPLWVTTGNLQSSPKTLHLNVPTLNIQWRKHSQSSTFLCISCLWLFLRSVISFGFPVPTLTVLGKQQTWWPVAKGRLA